MQEMISAVCKSPAEVFSHSLQSKLETLGCGDSEDVEPGGTESRSWFLRSRGFSAEMRGFPMPGTTFPPSNGIHFDLLRAKYHSESDLAASKSPFKKDLFGKDEDEEDCSVRSIEADGNDSDLFFDFDIESPDEDSDGAEEKTTAQIHAADNSSAPENCLKRRNSVDSCISSRGGDLTKASTAFGSASSGLWSDSYDGAMQCNPDLNDASVQQAIEDDLNTCLSLDPEDWLAQKRQQHNYPQQQQSGSNKEEVDRSSSSSNSTPITAMSPANMSSSPLVSPDSLLDETPDLQQAVHDEEEPARNETNKDDVKDEESDDEDGNPDFTNIGTAQVAKSKLDALIALLEKDRSFGSSSSESKKPAAPRQNSLEERRPSPFAASGSRAIPRRFSSNLPTIAASPANFSFLSPPKSPSSGQLGKKPVRDESPKTSPSRKKNPGSEEDFPSKSERLRRASSLKSGKTPPGSPGHSKFVRFADVLGLDLADIKLFKDEIPRIPKSAYFDLTNIDTESSSDSDSESGAADSPSPKMRIPQVQVAGPPLNTYRTLVPMFNQPGSFANFFDLLRSKKVCLENAYMATSTKTIRGTVRVQNITFSKRVIVRYTTNDWAKSVDLEATYLPGSCDGFSDKFTFCVTVASYLKIGLRFQFCLKFLADDNQEYWDNNDGRNYVFQCLSQSSGPAPAPAQAQPSVTLGVPVPKSSAAPQRPSDPYSSFSANSPSAMSEDPWLRYL